MVQRTHLLSGTLLTAWLFSSHTAAAQEQALEEKYKAALAERDAGNFEIACPKLSDIVKQRADASGDPSKGLGARLELAVCFEGWGKLASAGEQYALVEKFASAAGQKERSKRARERAVALLPRVARIRIRVPQSVVRLTGVSISLDGNRLERELWDTLIPVDRGRHSVTVEATGRLPWKGLTGAVTDGVRVSVVVKEPRVDGLHVGQDESLEMTSEPVPEEAESETPRPWQRPLAYGIFGLGMVGIGVAAGLAVDAADKLRQSNTSCTPAGGKSPDLCDQPGLDLRTAGRASADASTALMIAGGFLMAGGVVVWLAAPSHDVDTATTSVRVAPLPGGGVVAFHGVW